MSTYDGLYYCRWSQKMLVWHIYYKVILFVLRMRSCLRQITILRTKL